MQRQRNIRQEVKLRALLKEARKKMNLSQVELSLLCKSPQSFVSKYETGERYLTFTEVLVLCKMLHIDLPALIAEVDSDS